MKKVLVEVSEPLRAAMWDAKYLPSLHGKKLSDSEWTQLGTLLLLWTLGKCQTEEDVKRLDVSSRAYVLFVRLLDGRDL